MQKGRSFNKKVRGVYQFKHENRSLSEFKKDEKRFAKLQEHLKQHQCLDGLPNDKKKKLDQFHDIYNRLNHESKDTSRKNKKGVTSSQSEKVDFAKQLLFIATLSAIFAPSMAATINAKSGALKNSNSTRQLPDRSIKAVQNLDYGKQQIISKGEFSKVNDIAKPQSAIKQKKHTSKPDFNQRKRESSTNATSLSRKKRSPVSTDSRPKHLHHPYELKTELFPEYTGKYQYKDVIIKKLVQSFISYATYGQSSLAKRSLARVDLILAQEEVYDFIANYYNCEEYLKIENDPSGDIAGVLEKKFEELFHKLNSKVYEYLDKSILSPKEQMILRALTETEIIDKNGKINPSLPTEAYKPVLLYAIKDEKIRQNVIDALKDRKEVLPAEDAKLHKRAGLQKIEEMIKFPLAFKNAMATEKTDGLAFADKITKPVLEPETVADFELTGQELAQYSADHMWDSDEMVYSSLMIQRHYQVEYNQKNYILTAKPTQEATYPGSESKIAFDMVLQDAKSNSQTQKNNLKFY